MPTPMRFGALLLVSAAILVAAAALRLVYARSLPVPFSGDSDYYTMVGENLYRGRGLVADYVWTYLAGIPDGLPAPSNEYWMPGPSFAIAAAFRLAGNASPRVAQLPSIAFDALLCALTFALGVWVFRRRDVALLAASLCAISFHLTAIAAYPDPFTMSGVFVNLSLLFLWVAWRGRPQMGLAAGLCAGLAYLSRTDGLLLAGAAAVVVWYLLVRKRRRRSAGLLALCFLAGLVCVAAPWMIRQHRVFGGRIGEGVLRAAFASDFSDLTRVDLSGLTLRAYLRAHPSAQLGFRTYVFLRELLVLAQLTGLMMVLAVIPLRSRDVREELLPWLAYVAFALIVPAYLVPVVALQGTFAHLATSIMPIVCLLGSKAAIDFVRQPGPSNGPLWLRHRWVPLALGIAWFPAWWLSYPKEANRTRRLRYPAVARAVRQDLSPRAAISDMAWGLWNAARIPCAQFPGDGARAALQVADAIGADYLITLSGAANRLPVIREVDYYPRFRLVARYPGSPEDLLVFRILPPGEEEDVGASWDRPR